MTSAVHRRPVLGWLLAAVGCLFTVPPPAHAQVRCLYAGDGCNEGYSGEAVFECLSGSRLRIVIANTSTTNADNPADNVLTSLTFAGPVPIPGHSARVTVARGSDLLPGGLEDCLGNRDGDDVTCEWAAGPDYCPNEPLCDGIDATCRSPVPQCGLSFVSSRRLGDVSCSPHNFALGTGSIDANDDGADFGLIGSRQVQPAGGFERIRDTAEVVIDVQGCNETRRLCDGVATFGAYFRHAAGLVVDSGPAPPSGVVFVAFLSGANEVPANASTAAGTVTATLNADDTLTYSIASTGFETEFSAAHVHRGPAGVAGPILFPIDCTTDGTICSGTSPLLDPAARALLLAGETYVNQHTAAFPGGEIRTQLVPLVAAGDMVTAGVRKSQGKVQLRRTRKSRHPGAEIRLDGSFELPSGVDLIAPTAVITRVLHETPGTGELTRGEDGVTMPPILLHAMKKYSGGRGEGTLASSPNTPYQGCRLTLKGRHNRVFDFSLQCRGSKGGATISTNPAGCGEGFESVARLTTELVLAGSSPVTVHVEHSWRCLGRTGRLRELRTVSVPGPAGDNDGDGSGPDANRPPQADFRVSAGAGTAPLTVGFGNRSHDPDGTVVAQHWDFGDGRVSAETHPVHTFTTAGRFLVTLRVTDNRGMPSTVRSATISVSSNSAPRAEFRAEPLSGDAPLTVLFTNRSNDSDGRVASFGWDFGDGTGSVLVNPAHTYVDPGSYVATLVVHDDRGTPSPPRRQTVTVTQATHEATNRAPMADFRTDPTRGIAPLPVRFTNRSSDPEDDTMAFVWDFGDGVRSTDTDPVHIYRDAGEFEATLTAIDVRGQTSALARESIVVTANRAPVTDFRAEPRRGDAPLTVGFTNRSSDADGAVVGFEWDFGDGSTSRAENPVHTFTTRGKYVVTLTATDDRGAVSERVKRETIEAE